MIEGKAADELGLEGMGHLTSLLHILVQVLLEGHEDVLVPSSTSWSLTLPMGEPIDDTSSPYSFSRCRTL